MKTVPTASDDLPPGYELVRVDSYTRLVLPSAAASASREALRQQEDAREATRRELLQKAEQERLDKEQAEVTDKAETTADHARASESEPAPGQYRVFPRWAEFVKGADDPAHALRSADHDVNERHAKLRKRLLQKGPDRRVARPAAWREAVDQLEASLPHFREPIGLLRNALALADATQRPVRVSPMLLLGPPGVGKTHFTHCVAELMGAPQAGLSFDTPTAGSDLRGSSSYWGNSSTGLLFNLICMGDCANPVVLLDELDKSNSGTSQCDIDPLAQLHGALEPESSRRTLDISVDIEFDASQVTYIATANTLRRLTAPILSRLEVFCIEPPAPTDSLDIARAVVNQVLKRLHLQDTLGFERKGLYVLAHLSPRSMLRTAEKAVAAAVAAGQDSVRESDLWAQLGPEGDGPRLH